jgi:hypothetical protein
MNKQGLFSNISLIYVRLPEQWKSVMYMPVCSEFFQRLSVLLETMISKWSKTLPHWCDLTSRI